MIKTIISKGKLMDPNRHNLESLLKLPTPRLLDYYKKNAHHPPFCVNREEYDEFFRLIKEELNKREHVE